MPLRLEPLPSSLIAITLIRPLPPKTTTTRATSDQLSTHMLEL
jgi:hypothetical protein